MIRRNTCHAALRALVCLVLALAGVACSSSGRNCNLALWFDHFGLRFRTPDRRAAVYAVSLRGGALDVRCRIHLSEEAFEDGAEQLGADDTSSDGGTRIVDCDPREGLSSAFDSVSWRFRREEKGFEVKLRLAMMMGTAPAQVRIEVLRDETVLAERTMRPDYTVTEPNGPGCGFRKAADIQLSLDD